MRTIKRSKLKYPQLAWGCYDNSSRPGCAGKTYIPLICETYNRPNKCRNSKGFEIYCSWVDDHLPAYVSLTLSEAIIWSQMQLKHRSDPMDSCELHPVGPNSNSLTTITRLIDRYRDVVRENPLAADPARKGYVARNRMNILDYFSKKLKMKSINKPVISIAKHLLPVVNMDAKDSLYSINRSSQGVYILFDRIDHQHYTLPSSDYRIVDDQVQDHFTGVTYDYYSGDFGRSVAYQGCRKKKTSTPKDEFTIEGIKDDNGEPMTYDKSSQPCLNYKRQYRDLNAELERIRQLPDDDD